MSDIFGIHYVFENPSLPYAYDAFEPHIDAKTMEVHHTKHLQTYVNNLNTALQGYPQYWDWSLEKLIRRGNKLPVEIAETVRHNAGGVFNHMFYFEGLGDSRARIIEQELSQKLEKTFGSFAEFENEFKRRAMGVFGSGYLWLVVNSIGNLKLVSTTNQTTTLTLDLCPILCIDLWEHAYYLRHLNNKSAYIDDFLDIINWQKAEQNYAACRHANCVHQRLYNM